MIPDIVRHILERRGMSPDEMERFISPSYERDLHDPFLMLDMEVAVWRIMQAAENGDRVVVYGDYDIDGITASAVMIEGLAALGIRASSYIPDRFEEGYGINRAALEALQAQGAQLVISVDCGITSVAEAAWARANGLDLIITDHHSVPEVIPEAVAVINPKRAGDPYPFKDLAGVGVAFKVIQALQCRTGKPALGQEKWLLDLVAFGTVCDVVSLVGENRAIVSYGLQVIHRTRRVGLRALALVGGVAVEKVTAHHLGFVFGPRMNAAGRLEHAARSLELVLTTDGTRAGQIAQELEVLNKRRRLDQDKIFEEADRVAQEYRADPVLVLAQEGWSHGVVGIVASKLAEKWQKPVLVAQIMGSHTKGSARSVGSYNMVEALRANGELFTKFGGHFFAAGYTLPTEQLEVLRQGLNRYWHESGSRVDQSVIPEIDVEMSALTRVNLELLNDIALLEPFGSANPCPIFKFSGLVVEKNSTMGKDGKHLRLGLRDSGGKQIAGVAFGKAERYREAVPGRVVSVVGELNRNEYQGRTTLQLMIAHLDHE